MLDSVLSFSITEGVPCVHECKWGGSGNWAGRFPCVSEKEENGSSASVPLRRCEDGPLSESTLHPSHCDAMAPYVQQVDEPASFVEMPPPVSTALHSST
ncbi:hypothetical protein CEXT_303801 [Caerostris extrusa]|uniref:Uncharacterized protein n=1 Tax=Caerostris extrusa TaxID=172846 RepID=A0AAV4MP19_CAEEX|nr:hypothetical protein CEXT_303801 [Caerostris extrusa]